MKCESCGVEGWLKTCRWRTGERKFVLCDSCYGPLASSLWIVRGEVIVAARCESCGTYLHPTEMAELRPGGGGKRDVIGGVCAACVR